MFEQRACGCPVNISAYPFRCRQHVSPARMEMPGLRRDAWYAANTCPFCGRVTPAGLCCSHDETCPTCEITTCERLDMMHWKMETATKTVCASTLKRFKSGKGRTVGDRGKLARIAAGELTLVGKES